MTGVTVRGLTPARTYQFRVCAVNQVGKGQYSAETSRCVTRTPWRGTGSLGSIELGHQPPPLSHIGGSREEARWLAGLARGSLTAEGSFLGFCGALAVPT